MPLFTRCNISLRCTQNVSSFSSNYPTDYLLNHFANSYFEWKQNYTELVVMVSDLSSLGLGENILIWSVY